jgi:hypothetical protein
MNKITFILVLVIALSTIAIAANITSNASGLWSSSAWPNTGRTGTITTLTTSTGVTGVGTLFTTEISVGNILKTTVNVVIGTVASVTDNTHLTLTANAANANSGAGYHSQGVGSGDNLTISSTFNVTVDVANAHCNTLSIDGNQTSNCSLTLNGTNTLTIAGAVTMNRPAAFNVNAGTLNAASINITGGTATNQANLNITTGTVTVTGNIAFLGGITTIQKITMGSGTLNIGGNLGAGGTFTAGTGTVNFDGTSAQIVGAYTYNNLTIDNLAGATVATPGITVNDILNLMSGVLNNSNPVTLGPSGSVQDNGGSLSAPLPVELTSFTAVLQGTSALLKWATATETNNSGFQIERSVEGSGVWAEVAFVNGAGTSSSPKTYSYEDKNLAPGKYVYRLKQIDNDGKTTIYNPNALPKVDAGVSNILQLGGNYPNPFNPTTNIQFSVPQDGYASLKVYNILGQEVATLFSGMAKAGHYIPATFNASRLASGIYFARLQYSNKSLVQRMLLTK